jgi:hypothetical protein
MEVDAALARLAADQYSLFTRAHARQIGMTDRMLTRRAAAGVVERVEPGIYRMAGAPPTWHQRVLAACWAERGLASHRTAAALWQFDGCHPGVVEILTERWHRRPNASVRVHETRLLHPDDITEVDGIPLSSAARTWVDLGAVLPTHRVEQALDNGPGRHLLVPEQVWECVERLDCPGRPWVRMARRLIAARLSADGVAPNTFEKLLFSILQRAGLPTPEAQVEVNDRDGTLIGRVDWLVERRLVLECDSERWHGSWQRRKADLRRDRRLAALGYCVLRFSWEDLTQHPDVVIADVRGALRAATA